MRIDGFVEGQINGTIVGEMHAVVKGDLNAFVSSGKIVRLDEEEELRIEEIKDYIDSDQPEKESEEDKAENVEPVTSDDDGEVRDE
jgi:hypothetical protein